MYFMKYVKGASEGTRRMKQTMEDLNLPAPEFDVKENGQTFVKVTLRNNIKQRRVWIDRHASSIVGEDVFDSLTSQERQVMNYAAEHAGINVSQAARLMGVTWVKARKVLGKLAESRILVHHHADDKDRDPKAHYTLKTRRP